MAAQFSRMLQDVRLPAAVADGPPAPVVEMFNKARTFFQDIKAKITGEKFITFDEAVAVLRDELNYPEDRALLFVRRFDYNNDGRLSVAEFTHFKTKINETKMQLVPKFNEYDVDGNGFITLQEASSILERPPFNFPASKVVFLLKRFDKDGNGKLDIQEFAGFYAEAKATHEDIATCFDQLDRDGNGVLSPDEVAVILRDRLGYDDSMVQHMMQMFDQNQDGSLDKAEFIQLWTGMFGQ